MKKTFKRLSVMIFIIFVNFLIINVFADNKPEVKEYVQTDNYSAVLYSDNKLYVWGTFGYGDTGVKNLIIENVTDIEENYDDTLMFVDTEKNLKVLYTNNTYNDETQEDEYNIVITDPIKTNVKELDDSHILTSDSKLYYYYYDRYDKGYVEKLVMNNVKEWDYNSSNDAYLLLDNDNKLYAYGTNIFGKKVNNGDDITLSPLLIGEDVREFSCTPYRNSNTDGNSYGNFYLTNGNELYVMSNELPYPKLLKNDVDKFLYNGYYIKDGKTYKINYRIENDNPQIYEEELLLNEELIMQANYYYDNTWYLTKEGNLYNYKLDKKYTNIKQIYKFQSDIIYVLNNDNELTNIKRQSIYDYDTSDYEDIYIENKVLENVKELIDEYTYVMEDETIYVKGNANYYDIADFNGNTSNKYKNFVVIKNLPNVSENISLAHISLDYNGKIDFVAGDTYDFYANLYPYNATNKDVVWESSNESVATVDEKGTITVIKEGKTKIKVKSTSSNLYDEVEIVVYPKNTGIEILGEDVITLNKYDEKLLKVKVTPDGVLNQKIKWTSDAGKDEDNNDIIKFYGKYQQYDQCYDGICPAEYDEVLFIAYKSGTYTITATTEDGLYSDSVTVKVEQGITSLGLNTSSNNVLGQTLYIYMAESPYMDLDVKVYPEDATDRELEYLSSDESIATVDESGRVTAKKSGKVAITYKAKNYDVERTINVLIFDKSVSTKLGDVDGDGIVDILDLVKLRRHVAGVEALQ